MRSIFLIFSVMLLVFIHGCSGDGGDGLPDSLSTPPPTEVINDPIDDNTDPLSNNDTPVIPGDVAYSNDTGLKSIGILAAPPLFISDEEPSANTQITVVAEGVLGETITLTSNGGGCGSVQGTSGPSPLSVIGNVGSNGECNIEASYLNNGVPQVIAGRFVVAATTPDLPPLRAESGTWKSGSLPSASTELDSSAKLAVGLPVISKVEGPLEFINGGSSEFTVESSSGSNIAAILVKLDSYDGYFHVPVYSQGNTGTFKLSFDADYFEKIQSRAHARATLNQNINITIIDDLNQVSESQTIALTANETGFGDVKVSISWNTATDVDLHVTDPNGVRTYYGNTNPGNGSTLDLDSNPGCEIDGINNENIFWETGTAVPGTYTVTVDMYDACDNGEGTGFASGTLTMIYNGDDAPQVVSWNLGSTGSKEYTFTHEGGESKVSGKVTYEDFPVSKTGLGSSRMLPVRFAKVEVVRDFDKEILATGSTDASGKYELTFKNDDTDHPGYFVIVYAQQDSSTLKQEVLDYSKEVYTFKTDTVVNEIETPEKENFDIAITKDKNAGAMNIFDVAVRCNDYARTNGGKVPEKLTFIWQKNGASGSYYSSAKKMIVLLGQTADPDEYDDLVIGHEYGHFVMDTYSKDNSPGGSHTLAPSTPTLAWSEGWATFFSAAALNKSFYVDTIASGVGSYDSLETLDSSIVKGNVGDLLDGNVSEAVVSAVLWDLHDSTNETSDTMSGKSTAIWKILTTYLKGTNFKDRGKTGVDTVDFLDGWFCLGYGSKGTSSTGVMGNVSTLHELNYDYKELESCK